ncbi:predicted protein [Naegleria gruberi]|uniref:Predicted protein n=1 Tax=Naegleria gruberi TaxID=5762 RepID=D2VWQ0_NAEGR|nr:uncharacterized protein NAEGRDRAFT_73461 [Naegleria gruberi]EFC38735.1 predicted protein [Naegleria gruberi]|eukprot:XP_002671479.1 predicted protein [Naegleria gruberi strain NEG-M]
MPQHLHEQPSNSSPDTLLHLTINKTDTTILNATLHSSTSINQDNDERMLGELSSEVGIHDEEKEFPTILDDDGGDEELIPNNGKNENSLKEKLKDLFFNMKSQFKHMIDIAFPIILMNVSNKMLGIEDLMFIGHLGNSQYMAGSALGNAIFFSLSFIAVGIISGQDTFVAQAFGAKNKPLVGVWMMRSFITLILFLLPVMVVLFFLESILNLVGMDEVTSHLSGQFVRYLLPGLIPFAFSRSTARFLTSVNIRLPNTLIPIAAVIVNFGLNWLFVFGIGFKGIGFLGAAIATTLTRLFIIFSYIYVLFHHRENIREILIGAMKWDEVFKWEGGFKVFFKQAIPGTIGVCAEVWAFEFTTIVASFISAVQVAAHSIVFNIASLSFMLPLALSNASCVMVGQKLGSNDPSGAKYAAYLCIFSSVVCMSVSGTIIGICSRWIPLLYTTDESVRSVASSILPIISVFAIVDGIQRTSTGVLRGASSQFLTMILNLIAYYLFSLPVSSLLAFVAKLELLGLWLGLTSCMVLMAVIVLIYIIFRIDWVKEARIAHERANKIIVKTEKSEQETNSNTSNTQEEEETRIANP